MNDLQRVDASRWARSVGLSMNCEISADALERIGGFKRGIAHESQERVAAVAMSILTTARHLSLLSMLQINRPTVFRHPALGYTVEGCLSIDMRIHPSGNHTIVIQAI